MEEQESIKGKNKPLFKLKFGAVSVTGWLNKSKTNEQFVTADVSRSFKKDDKWVEKKISGITVKSLNDLELAIAATKQKFAEYEPKQ